jgi:hypothetical protein
VAAPSESDSPQSEVLSAHDLTPQVDVTTELYFNERRELRREYLTKVHELIQIHQETLSQFSSETDTRRLEMKQRKELEDLYAVYLRSCGDLHGRYRKLLLFRYEYIYPFNPPKKEF